MPKHAEILQAIADAPGGTLGVEQIVTLCEPVTRKTMFKRIAPLVSQALVTVARRQAGFCGLRSIAYTITPAGRAFLVSGKQVIRTRKPGPPRRKDGSFRQVLWDAFRLKRRTTVADLVEVTGNLKEPVQACNQAREYLACLARAGIARSAGRVETAAPTSNGAVVYILVNNLGPLAPQIGAAGVFDPNSKTRLPMAAKAKITSRKKVR